MEPRTKNVIYKEMEVVRGMMRDIWLELGWEPSKDSFLEKLRTNPDVAIAVDANPVFAKHSPLFLSRGENEAYDRLEDKFNTLQEEFSKAP